ncbi:hypothetical protein [Ideonella sp. YS5]|uniref:hypothetical protein n=1 Tax=Ideonella sp. YS5 TaxID=3453714 RepID=UPI003EEBE216
MDYRALFVTPLAALVLSVGATGLQMPAGWQAGKSPRADAAAIGAPVDQYEIGIDAALPGSSPSLTVRSVAKLNPGILSVGHAYQSVSGYSGQRVRFSGQARAEAGGGWGGLYLGLGEMDHDLLTPVAMGQAGVEKRLPVGAVPAADDQWHEVSVVLDVPANAPWLTLGVAQVGEGQVWVRDLKFEVVGPDVPATTTPIGIDWAQARRNRVQQRETLAAMPPQPLRNAALD